MQTSSKKHLGASLHCQLGVAHSPLNGINERITPNYNLENMFTNAGHEGRLFYISIDHEHESLVLYSYEQVDFDKTKHLTDKTIKRRELETKKIRALLLEKERKKQAEREYEENKKREIA